MKVPSTLAWLVLSLTSSTDALPRRDHHLAPRIMGGSTASKGAYPFIVYLHNNAEHTFCGGSILSSQWVVTAAHCIKTAKISDIDVYVGQYNYNLDTSKATGLVEMHVHPQYNDASMVNDIALLRLSKPISSNASPIEIDTGSVGDGITVTALGWGFTSPTGKTASQDLKQGDLTTLSTAQCQQKDTKFTGNNGPRICVAADRGTDTCPGDSGGPLIRKVNGRNKLLGITSFGTAGPGQQITVNCGGSGMISLFTHVNSFTSFIQSATGGLPSGIESGSPSSNGDGSSASHSLHLENSRLDQGQSSLGSKTLATSSFAMLGLAVVAMFANM